MRAGIVAGAVLAVAAISIGATRMFQVQSAGTEPRDQVLYYVDPMHPSYKSKKPGIAPDCGMPLKPVYASTRRGGVPDTSGKVEQKAIEIDDATARRSGIRFADVTREIVNRHIRALARISAEDTRTYKINSGVDGFIRETYNDSPGMPVKRNQRLAAYYAPDFLAASSGFLAASERVPGSVTKEGARSIQNYMDRLRNLGMSDVQISRMAETHQLPESIDIVSPADGFIVSRNISPGQHFEHGMELYTVADLSKVWVLAEVSADEARLIRSGDAGEIRPTGLSANIRVHVAGNLQQSESGGAFVQVRLEADNPAYVLRPQMLVEFDMAVRSSASVTVPIDAFVNSAGRQIVYVAHGDSAVEPRYVETGMSLGDRVEVTKGLTPGDRIVASGAFLIDSESRLGASGRFISALSPAAADRR